MDCEFCTDPATHYRVVTIWGVKSVCQSCYVQYGRVIRRHEDRHPDGRRKARRKAAPRRKDFPGQIHFDFMKTESADPARPADSDTNNS